MATNIRKDRKQCSLSLLTQMIMQCLPSKTEGQIYEMTLSEIYEYFSASVDKSRVTEIFVILESLLIVTKIGAESYRWNGYDKIRETLTFLRMTGDKLGIQRDIEKANHAIGEQLLRESSKRQQYLNDYLGKVTDATIDEEPSQVVSHELPEACLHMTELCQRFVMIFLLSKPNQSLSVEFCTQVLKDHLGSYSGKSCRTLYNFSGVLSSMPNPILKKVATTSAIKGRELRYAYCGPDVFGYELSESEVYQLPEHRRFFKGRPSLISWGKEAHGFAERPARITGLETVRLAHTEAGNLDLAEGASRLHFLSQVALADRKEPFEVGQILKILSERFRFPLDTQRPPVGQSYVDATGQSCHLFPEFVMKPGRSSIVEILKQ